MNLKDQLLESVRTGIVSSVNAQKADIDKIAADHFKILDELATWPDDKFEAKWHNFILASGAGPFMFLREVHKQEKVEQDKEKMKAEAEAAKAATEKEAKKEEDKK